MTTKLLPAILLMATTTFLFSQNNPWVFVNEANLFEKDATKRQIIPQQYLTLRMDVPQMQSILKEAPLRGTEDANKKDIRLVLPLPDGSFGEFRIFYTPVMHPDLAAKYPMIRTYSGYRVGDPTTSVYFDLTQKGFHGYIRSPKHSDVFIDPYSTGQLEEYICYYKKDFYKNTDWQCLVDGTGDDKKDNTKPNAEKAGDNQHRTYRLALACTGEYAAFHGGNKPAVLAAMNTTMNRVNGVTENEFSVRMELVPNNDDLIFLNAGTDPYTNNDGGTMLGQNQTTCDNVIGSANYDIGHVFSTGGGGVAYLGCVCSSIKAGGVTGQSSPVGDPFDIDYVAHEMGHQYGANHTQYNPCNRENLTAMEPGSASTIMGYAGICSPNVQNNSDAYYHAASLAEIGAFITGGGNSCAAKTTSNNAPTANAGANYTIPKSTYFVLTGSGTDTNGDTLTYCWEQMDNQGSATMPPLATNTVGPMFRSFTPTESPSRYFPNLNAILNNSSPTWEVLPSSGRTLNFRLTVRDNHFGGGATEEDDMVVTVAGGAGPFVVTSPNTNVTWPALSSQTVTWNVAGTTAAPVSAATVDIFLSTDGGMTYPITLLTGTPNDGSQVVTLPNNQTSSARIMVRGANNIFFDISNTNFTISAPAAGFDIDVSPNSQAVCAPANGVFSIDVQAFGGFSGNVDLSVTGVPAGASAAFSVDPVAAPGTSQLTISGTGSVASGSYNLTVTGSNGGNDVMETVTLVVTNGLPATVSLLAPSDGATGVSIAPTLTWNAASGAVSYQVQVATDAGFVNIVADQSGIAGTSYNLSGLNTGTTYHWRVRGANLCGNGSYAAAFDFTTVNTACNTYTSTDVPKNISTSGPNTVTSNLTIAANGTINDVNVVNLNITHTWVDDLRVKLKSPAGTEIILIERPCDDEDNIAINFDDESGNAHGTIPCPPTGGGTYQPLQALTAFDGQNLNGTWTLTVEDLAAQDGGSLDGWGLYICYQPTVNCPDNITINSGTPITALFQADNFITTSGAVIIPNAMTTDFKAGNHVEMNAEFQVNMGAVFTASIEGCPTARKEEKEEK